MILFTLKRVIGLFPVALGVITIVALFIHTVPGDPVDTILGDYATLEEKTVMRSSLGLDKPIAEQLLNYYGMIAHGNLGDSLIYHRPVSDLILERVRATAELAFISMLVAIMIGIPMGVISAVKKGRTLDTVAMGIALLGVAIPNFWLGPMLILLFSLELGWLPVSERGNWQTYILPAITMGTALAAIISRMTRNSMLDNIKEDYARTARSKGVSEFSILSKHVFRNASLPLVTIVGLQFGALLTGAVITERIFDWPGLGTLMLDGLGNRDYPLVQGCVLFFSGTYLAINLITDISYALIDPRIDINR